MCSSGGGPSSGGGDGLQWSEDRAGKDSLPMSQGGPPPLTITGGGDVGVPVTGPVGITGPIGLPGPLGKLTKQALTEEMFRSLMTNNPTLAPALQDAVTRANNKGNINMADLNYSARYDPTKDSMTTDPYFQSTQDKLKAAQDALNNRQAPLIPQDNQFRTGQADLMAALQQRASGQAPSIAEQQLLSGRDANIRALQAGAASQRGQMGGGTQMRGLQQAAGNQMLQTNQQAAELRIKEQQSAEAALVQALASARGQDISIDEANQRAQIQKQAMVDDMTKYYTTLGFSNEQAQVQAQRDYEKMLMDQTYRYEALKKGIGIQERGQDIGLWTNVLGSGMKAAGDVGSYLSMGGGDTASAVGSVGDGAEMLGDFSSAGDTFSV